MHLSGTGQKRSATRIPGGIERPTETMVIQIQKFAGPGNLVV